MEVGIPDRGDKAPHQIGKSREGTPAVNRSRAGESLIDVPTDGQLVSFRSYVGQVNYQVAGEFALHTEAPLIYVGRSEIVLDAWSDHRGQSYESIRKVGPVRWLERSRCLTLPEGRISEKRGYPISDDLVVVEGAETSAHNGSSTAKWPPR